MRVSHFIVAAASNMLLQSAVALGQTTECEHRCVQNYNNTQYGRDIQICNHTNAVGRCIAEMWQNVKIYCAQKCEDNPRSFEPQQLPLRDLQIERPPADSEREPRRSTPSAPGGPRG